MESQFSLLRMEVLQKFELFRSEVHDALTKLQVALVLLLPPGIHICFVDEGFECCFGEFSPRTLHASSSVTRVVAAEVVAPVVENFPELPDHCGEPSVVLPVELGLLEPLSVDIAPSPPVCESCELPSSVDSGGPSIRSPLFDREGMLEPIDQAVFVKKLGGLLACLEAASPGTGKAIACLIAEDASTDKIKR